MKYIILSPVVTETDIHSLYEWIDTIPLSRPKKNISRDFSDGVMLAEVIRHFYPKIVEVHNYISSSTYSQKVNNWNLLNKKVLSKLFGGVLHSRDIEECASASPGAIERVLHYIKPRLPSVPNQMLPCKEEKNSPREAQKPSKKEPTVDELQTTVTTLQERVTKLEQLVQIKDLKIKTLQEKLQELGVNIRKV